MRNRVDNVFTYYRGPSERNRAAELGTQMEDNATAALLKTIKEVSSSKRDPHVSSSILNSLIGDGQNVPKTSDIHCSDQEGVSGIHTKNRTIYLVGLSPSGLDLSNVDPSNATGEEGIVDGVIEIGDDVTIVLEVKTKGDRLSRRQLEQYANELQISPDEYNTVTWGEIAETISGLLADEHHPVTDFLLEELYEFIELTTLHKTIAAAHWVDDGEYKFNTLTLRYRRSLSRRTKLAGRDGEPPRIHLEFRSTGYKPISFSPSEWQAAVNQFPKDIRRGFIEGDFQPFLDLMADEGRTTLAVVGDEDATHKIIEVNPDYERITVQSKTSDSNSHYINRPTIHRQDFEKYYKAVEPNGEIGTTPYLQPEGQMVQAIFSDGDLFDASTFNIG
jgi:hypothetical protein